MTHIRNTESRKNERRVRALDRLRAQFTRGTKPIKRTHPFHNRRLTIDHADWSRMQGEVDRLESRIRPASVTRAIRTKKDRSGTGRLSR